MLLDDGSVKEAAEAARTAITFDAGSVAAHYTLGLTAIALERFDEAEREFLKVVELNPRAAAQRRSNSRRLRLAAGDAEARPQCRPEGGRGHPGGSGSHGAARPQPARARASSRRPTRRSPPRSAAARYRRAPHRARLGPARSARLDRRAAVVRRSAAIGARVGRSTHRPGNCVSGRGQNAKAPDADRRLARRLTGRSRPAGALGARRDGFRPHRRRRAGSARDRVERSRAPRGVRSPRTALRRPRGHGARPGRV